MYFNTVLTDSAKLLKPLLVFSFIMLAILAGLTRIIQFRNHPVDVYCGWLLGGAIAVYLVIHFTSVKVTNQPQITALPVVSDFHNSSYFKLK